jgi:hypothetical protein
VRDTGTDLNELFAKFEAETTTSFRPPGVPAAQRRTRARRRRRRALLTGVVALLLAGPGGAFALADRGDRADPTPVVIPSPEGRLTVRKVTLPGVRGELSKLRFVDGRTGWALFDTCGGDDPDDTGCLRTLGRTTDGGATWQRAALPAAPDGPVQLLPVDGRRLTVQVGPEYLVTVDGGATFSRHPITSTPAATLAALATRSGFLVACPSFLRPGGGAGGRSCTRESLLRIDDDPLPRQPPVILRQDDEHSLVEGRDGRLWLSVATVSGGTVVTSDDRGATWTTLAAPGPGRLTVSPDGAEVWFVDTEGPRSVWRLVGDRWEQRGGLPDDSATAAAAGAGIIAVTSRYGGAGFWVDGRYVDVPELRDPLRSDPDAGVDLTVLPDGTVLIGYGRTQILGTGTGTDRTWTWIS